MGTTQPTLVRTTYPSSHTYIHAQIEDIYEGKWHLGGMREEQRKDRANDDRSTQPILLSNIHNLKTLTYLLKPGAIARHRTSTGSRNTSPSWTDQRAQDILSWIETHSYTQKVYVQYVCM